jgi:hypothetical protein
MTTLVLIHTAINAGHTQYTARHISLLLRQGKIRGHKEGRIWLVDLDDLKRFEAEMDEIGSKKFDPTKNK